MTLNDAMEKASDFREAWKKEVDWLNEAERQAYADWKSCGLPETCEADIYKHEVCNILQIQWYGLLLLLLLLLVVVVVVLVLFVCLFVCLLYY